MVKHTGCGMLTFKNEDAYGIVEKNLGYVPIARFCGSAGLEKWNCRGLGAY